MINGRRIAIVMPAYNAEETLEQTLNDLPGAVDVRILVDDCRKDKMKFFFHRLGIVHSPLFEPRIQPYYRQLAPATKHF